MKTLLTLLFFLVISLSAIAQTPVATPVPPHLKSNPQPDTVDRSYYCCRICDYTAKSDRQCPVHQVSLVKVGNWYCPADGFSADKPGSCPDDHNGLIQMKMKFKTVTPKPEDMKNDQPVKK